jgi:hypothetical protein
MALRARSGAGPRRAPRRGPQPRIAFLAALYAVAAFIATWPAVGSFFSAFIADGEPGFGEAAAGDHLQSVYRFWLLGHQLEHAAAPWRDPYSFQPLVDPQFALGGWPWGIPFWPLEAAFGPVVAWNVLLLAGIVAAGLLTYGWLRALDLEVAAAAVGGLAFAVAPYRIEQSGGHLLGWIAVLLPLCLLAIERSRSAETGTAAHAWGALAAVALVSIPLSGQVHLALGAVPLALAYAAVRSFSPRDTQLSDAPTGRVPFTWTLAGAVAAVGVGLAIRYTIIAGSIEAGGRSLAEVELFQASWGALADRFPPNAGEVFASERFVYTGWLTPLLAAAGLAVLIRTRRWWLALVLGLAALAPILLALGTNVPLYEPLWNALPPFRFPRVPERLMPVACLALAALAAFGISWLLRVVPRRRAVAVVLTVLVVGADLIVQPLGASEADPANEAYAALPSSGRTLELPLFEPGIHFGSVYLYYELQAPRERPGGYSTLAPPPAFDFYFRFNRLSCGIWLPDDEAALREYGVGPFLFHAGLYEQAQRPGAWFAWRALEEQGYRAAATGGQVTLFERGRGPMAPPPVAEPNHGQVVFCEGWHEWTMLEREGPLWIYGEHTVELELTAPATTTARVWVDGAVVDSPTVARRATVSVDLEGDRWHWVMLEVPRLVGTAVPRGLTIARMAFN